MPSETKETQLIQAMNTVAEFVKILVKEYPLVFNNGSGDIRIHPSKRPYFPFDISLEIRKKG